MQLPKITAKAEDPVAAMVEFQNRFKNSSRTVLSWNMVSGDNPSERMPSHFGVKSHQGTRLPFITSGAALKLVVSVQ